MPADNETITRTREAFKRLLRTRPDLEPWLATLATTTRIFWDELDDARSRVETIASISDIWSMERVNQRKDTVDAARPVLEIRDWIDHWANVLAASSGRLTELGQLRNEQVVDSLSSAVDVTSRVSDDIGELMVALPGVSVEDAKKTADGIRSDFLNAAESLVSAGFATYIAQVEHLSSELRRLAARQRWRRRLRRLWRWGLVLAVVFVSLVADQLIGLIPDSLPQSAAIAIGLTVAYAFVERAAEPTIDRFLLRKLLRDLGVEVTLIRRFLMVITVAEAAVLLGAPDDQPVPERLLLKLDPSAVTCEKLRGLQRLSDRITAQGELISCDPDAGRDSLNALAADIDDFLSMHETPAAPEMRKAVLALREELDAAVRVRRSDALRGQGELLLARSQDPENDLESWCSQARAHATELRRFAMDYGDEPGLLETADGLERQVSQTEALLDFERREAAVTRAGLGPDELADALDDLSQAAQQLGAALQDDSWLERVERYKIQAEELRNLGRNV